MAKYIPVGQPSNESERMGIRQLRDQLPNHYVVIGNLDLTMPRRKNTMEFDAVVVGEWGLHAVEIKGWTGKIEGNKRVWELEWGPRAESLPPQRGRKPKRCVTSWFNIWTTCRRTCSRSRSFSCRSMASTIASTIATTSASSSRGRVHDFFVDEDRMLERGPGPLLDADLRQKVVDAIIPLAEPAPGLPRIEAYEIEGGSITTASSIVSSSGSTNF